MKMEKTVEIKNPPVGSGGFFTRDYQDD